MPADRDIEVIERKVRVTAVNAIELISDSINNLARKQLKFSLCFDVIRRADSTKSTVCSFNFSFASCSERASRTCLQAT